MSKINNNFLKLHGAYLFPEINKRVNKFKSNNPESINKIISCGIGDVTEPIPQAARDAMHNAIDELGQTETFRGYGPSEGYEFIRKAIVDNNYNTYGIDIDPDEIFLSDGAKCDTANILDIFSNEIKIAVMDPVYPVYVDTNVMAGNGGEPKNEGKYSNIVYLECNPENNFNPSVDLLKNEKIDIVYLCYPNNPTGACADKDTLKKWVNYALKNNVIILYDAAYEAFIKDKNIPHSIYEIEGADKCAIEFCSFSKNGGFTGVRCAWTVLPKKISIEDTSLHSLWTRRQNTKFNGVSYIVQRGAEALYSSEGKKQVTALIEHYLENAKLLKEALDNNNFTTYGGNNAPYIWVKCLGDLNSWEMFDVFLEKNHIICTPGSGFGSAGEGYFRLSSFNSRKNIQEVCDRINNFNN